MYKKHVLTVLIAFIVLHSYGQNTFPSSGNVGINTTNPSAKLDVNGNMIVDSCLIVKDSIIVEKDLRTKGKFIVEDQAFFLEKVYMNDQLILSSDLIANNGVIVEGLAEFNSELKLNNLSVNANPIAPDVDVILKDALGNVSSYKMLDLVNLIIAESEPVQIQTCLPGYAAAPYWINAVNKLYTVCDEVLVGVGTNNPQFKLHVEGTSFTDQIIVGAQDNTTSAMAKINSTNNNTDILRCGKKIGSNPEELRFRISNDGMVEIHNTSSGTAFTIFGSSGNSNSDKIFQVEDNGLVRAREMRIDLQAWPDYVFDPNYEFLTLEELETYVKKNHHLPNVPSEFEIENGDIGIGEISKIQMEKIEELSLYIIQLNNQIKTLSERVESLEEQLNQ